jgi:Domain of unknown function (DUF4136)
MLKIFITKNLFLALTSAALLTLGGCASAPDVRVAMDRSADFTQYKTFAFASSLGTDRSGYQSIVSQELKASTQREMQARGMRLVAASPQLLVNFSAAIVDKTRVSTMPVFIGMDDGFGYYGYRRDFYSPWPMYIDQTVVTQYKEGTLNIDVVDAARKQLVWEGVVTDTVSQKDLQNLAASINEAVTAAFAQYPIKPLLAVKTK